MRMQSVDADEFNRFALQVCPKAFRDLLHALHSYLHCHDVTKSQLRRKLNNMGCRNLCKYLSKKDLRCDEVLDDC